MTFTKKMIAAGIAGVMLSISLLANADPTAALATLRIVPLDADNDAMQLAIGTEIRTENVRPGITTHDGKADHAGTAGTKLLIPDFRYGYNHKTILMDPGGRNWVGRASPTSSEMRDGLIT